MRIIGIVQARMGSTRLPGKVLRQLGSGTVLSRVVRAARESGALDEVVVATSVEPDDDAVEAECARIGAPCYRGSVDDVLGRFIGALDEHPADAVMRLTADSPLLDPEVVALAARVFRSVPGLDYLSTSIARYLPLGLDVEIVSADVLRTVGRLATRYHRTHVTSYIYTHAESFRIIGLTLPPDTSQMRLTLDTEADWNLVTAVVEQFGDGTVSLRKLTDWLAANPGVRALNASIEQKAIDQG